MENCKIQRKNLNILSNSTSMSALIRINDAFSDSKNHLSNASGGKHLERTTTLYKILWINPQMSMPNDIGSGYFLT